MTFILNLESVSYIPIKSCIMKKLLCFLVLLSSAIAIQAQEIKTSHTNNNQPKEITTSKENSAQVLSTIATDPKSDLDKINYSETSKIAFYETLISKNGFDIQLENSIKKMVIRNTEQIINRKQKQILYSEEE